MYICCVQNEKLYSIFSERPFSAFCDRKPSQRKNTSEWLFRTCFSSYAQKSQPPEPDVWKTYRSADGRQCRQFHIRTLRRRFSDFGYLSGNHGSCRRFQPGLHFRTSIFQKQETWYSWFSFAVSPCKKIHSDPFHQNLKFHFFRFVFCSHLNGRYTALC